MVSCYPEVHSIFTLIFRTGYCEYFKMLYTSDIRTVLPIKSWVYKVTENSTDDDSNNSLSYCLSIINIPKVLINLRLHAITQMHPLPTNLCNHGNHC